MGINIDVWYNITNLDLQERKELIKYLQRNYGVSFPIKTVMFRIKHYTGRYFCDHRETFNSKYTNDAILYARKSKQDNIDALSKLNKEVQSMDKILTIYKEQQIKTMKIEYTIEKNQILSANVYRKWEKKIQDKFVKDFPDENTRPLLFITISTNIVDKKEQRLIKELNERYQGIEEKLNTKLEVINHLLQSATTYQEKSDIYKEYNIPLYNEVANG